MIPLQFVLLGGLELMILALIMIFFLIVPFVLTYWVYNDTERRGNENAALWAVVVVGLTFLTVFGGILTLVVYLWDRD